MEFINAATQITEKGVRHLFPEVVERACEVLRAGGVIVYPTDTIYGLGADATNHDAVVRVQRIKGRAPGHSILALASGIAMVEEYAHVTALARALADAFLPGPLSLILTARGTKLSALAGSDNTVGFRIPNHPLSLALAQTLGRPCTSTSVNRSGEPPLLNPSTLTETLGDAAHSIKLVLDAGPSTRALPSTIVDARGERALILREGAIPRQELAAFL
jgi:L-threonylcarbamoyladenylate synthase